MQWRLLIDITMARQNPKMNSSKTIVHEDELKERVYTALGLLKGELAGNKD